VAVDIVNTATPAFEVEAGTRSPVPASALRPEDALPLPSFERFPKDVLRGAIEGRGVDAVRAQVRRAVDDTDSLFAGRPVLADEDTAQAAVFYDADVVLGGGWIERPE